MTEHTEKGLYPRLVGGRWCGSVLEHLHRYAERGREHGETHVAVPIGLLYGASRFRECSVRQEFRFDEDGPMPPFWAVCRRQDGHDAAGNPDHVRQHSNGYYTWDETRVLPPESGKP